MLIDSIDKDDDILLRLFEFLLKMSDKFTE